MKRILILGGSGMLGHKAYQILSNDFDTYVTFRSFDQKLKQTNVFDQNKVFDRVDTFQIDSVSNVIDTVKPDVVVNCIGAIKQSKEAQIPKFSIYVNSLFPHVLAELTATANARLIHISTDCVFSGRKGDYVEGDLSDAEDLYGKTKYLGEIQEGNVLTLRTSIIGHELFTNVALVDWFISKENKVVNGFTNAFYTGFPTITFCHEIIRVIKNYPDLVGLYNISSDKISKFELLNLIKRIYNLKIEIKPFDDFYCDRSLNSDKYRQLTNFHPPPWEEMLRQMNEDRMKNNYRKKI